jgi:hypothetical protein
MNKQEYRKRLDILGNREDLIPGIHNYCDRWCERCRFTAKCGSYALTEGFDESQENNDLQNEKFWKDLHMIFEVTFDMVKEKAEELGIDIESLDEGGYKCEVVENEAVKMSKKYGFEIIDWLKSNGNEINKLAEKHILINEKETLKLQDAIEVIHWYSHFISAKIHRVFMDYGQDDDDYDFQYDRLGSSKIAVIAIERSISAFVYLLECLPNYEDELLNFLANLSRIKKDLLIAFPKTMDFKRPGFDD